MITHEEWNEMEDFEKFESELTHSDFERCVRRGNRFYITFGCPYTGGSHTRAISYDAKDKKVLEVAKKYRWA